MKVNGKNVSVVHNPNFPLTLKNRSKKNMATKAKRRNSSGGTSGKSRSRRTRNPRTAIARRRSNPTRALAATTANPRKGRKTSRRRRNPSLFRKNPGNSISSLFMNAGSAALVAFGINYGVNWLIPQPTSMWGRAGLKAALAIGLHKYGKKILGADAAQAGAGLFAAFAIYDIVAGFAPSFLPAPSQPLFVQTGGAPVIVDTDQQNLGNLVDFNPNALRPGMGQLVNFDPNAIGAVQDYYGRPIA